MNTSPLSQDGSLHPPYALPTVGFPLPALAALAGRLPLGDGREVALATLCAARLATGLLPPDTFGAEDRQVRAEATRVWLAALTLPSVIRDALMRVVDGTIAGPIQAAGALRVVSTAADGVLDAASSLELERLVRRLAAVT